MITVSMGAVLLVVSVVGLSVFLLGMFLVISASVSDYKKCKKGEWIH